MERLDGRALRAITPDEQIGDRQALARTLFDTLLVSCGLSSWDNYGMLWHAQNWTAESGVGVDRRGA
jgi:hypothetical protein